MEHEEHRKGFYTNSSFLLVLAMNWYFHQGERKSPLQEGAVSLWLVVGRLGFEPGMTEPKPVVLPLHHRPIA